ncbi:MAG: flagellin [Clostridiaceae bacterium]|nr:flagellin [Eubacteriales bacterium]
MRIANNAMAINTHRQYTTNNANVANATEKLSSGYRINRAGDDAAGLAISEKMRAQIKGLTMASKNSQDAISLVQTAEGALTETHSILQRMRELSVQAASDTNDQNVDRAALNEEFTALKEEINDIAKYTKFNGKNLLNGDFSASQAKATGLVSSIGVSVTEGAEVSSTTAAVTLTASYDAGAPNTITINSVDFDKDHTVGQIGTSGVTLDLSKVNWDDIDDATAMNQALFGADTAPATVEVTFTDDKSMTIQTGADKGEELKVGIGSMTAETLKINDATIETRENASNSIETVNKAINDVSTQRAKLGAYQNRLQHKINNLDTSAENLQAAESRIRDLDMAKEMTNYTKNNILVQASTAMLAQANAAPQGVLQLLQ